jgi:hypothetical protein
MTASLSLSQVGRGLGVKGYEFQTQIQIDPPHPRSLRLLDLSPTGEVKARVLRQCDQLCVICRPPIIK